MKRPEQALQMAIIQLMDLTSFPDWFWPGQTWLMPPTKIGEYLHHTPNGGGRSKAEAGIFKAMGVRAGYPDLSLDIALTDNSDNRQRVYPGWRCELKAGRGRLSKNQTLWRERLVRAGYIFDQAESVDEFLHKLHMYLHMGKPLYRGIGNGSD